MAIGQLPFFREDGTLRERYVYMLSCRDGDGPVYIKIGHTLRPDQRLPMLLTGCPVTPLLFCYASIVPALKAQRVEALMHKLLSKQRLRGEWFRSEKVNPLEDPRFMISAIHAFRQHNVPQVPWTAVDVPAWLGTRGRTKSMLEADAKPRRRRPKLVRRCRRQDEASRLEAIEALKQRATAA